MGQIQVEDNCGGIQGLKVITPTVHGDDRGYFMETYQQRDFAAAGIDVTFVQDNQSSSKKGVLRGLHFQIQYAQSKLVRVVNGAVFDVAVDLRPGSETFGKWFGVLLTAENKKQFFIPKNFAHGFLVLSDEAGIAWNDPAIGVEWPELTGDYAGTASAEGYAMKDGTALTLSEKDQKWGGLDAYRKAYEGRTNGSTGE